MYSPTESVTRLIPARQIRQSLKDIVLNQTACALAGSKNCSSHEQITEVLKS